MTNPTAQPEHQKATTKEPHPAPTTEGPVDVPLAAPDEAGEMVTGDESVRASERPHRPDGPSEDELSKQSTEAGPQSEVGDDR
jgi:hypothetical protein